MKPVVAAVMMSLIAVGLVVADGPADNLAEKVRRIPPTGIKLEAKDRAELTKLSRELGSKIEELRTALKDSPRLLELLPDVEIYHNAIRYALAYDEFFKAAEVGTARKLAKQGLERADSLRAGLAPWSMARGLVVRGYRSRIDNSAQPYGLVVPLSYQQGTAHRHRLDGWFHGRGETLSELNFIDDRQRNPGPFTPPHAFVLHPYGRYCNANKFAGEIDFLEALDHVKKHYAIDEDRIAVRGFSMGGAACWQFAVHYPSLWAAAAPGAGFSETADFLRVFQNEPLKPTWYEQKLWHLYDCTDYAVNLFNLPTVAYSGAIDRQKQAADVMAKAMIVEGLRLVHILGPETGHNYHPQAKEEINRRIDSIVAKGRDALPREVRFTTWTLRYNQMQWVVIDALAKHWERARIDATILDNHTIQATTKNIAALSLSMPPGHSLFADYRVVLDGQEPGSPPVLSDRSWTAHYRKDAGKWKRVDTADDGTLTKRHGLQGPIDDAFMDRFVMVRPTGKAAHERTGAWAAAELNHAITHWRQQFRGDALVVDDDKITDAIIASSNLVLWGDPSSNKLLARIADKLPIRWDASTLRLGEKSFSAEHHVPVLIYPNPLNPKKYVVLNSGFTFREYDYLNNARQVPKLPDYGVLDVRVPPSSRAPGKVVEAGFFDERWQLPPVK